MAYLSSLQKEVQKKQHQQCLKILVYVFEGHDYQKTLVIEKKQKIKLGHMYMVKFHLSDHVELVYNKDE